MSKGFAPDAKDSLVEFLKGSKGNMHNNGRAAVLRATGEAKTLKANAEILSICSGEGKFSAPGVVVIRKFLSEVDNALCHRWSGESKASKLKEWLHVQAKLLKKFWVLYLKLNKKVSKRTKKTPEENEEEGEDEDQEDEGDDEEEEGDDEEEEEEEDEAGARMIIEEENG